MAETHSNKADYGNWVPKRILLLLLLIALVFTGIAFSPVPVIARFVVMFVAGPFWLGFLYLGYAYLVFSANGGNLQSRIRGMVLANLPWNGRGKALDIGTGGGALAIRLAKKYAGAKVTGIDYWGICYDYSQKMCEDNAAIEGVGERIDFKKASAASLPFENEVFDAIVSNFAFHHVRDAKDKRDVLREGFRVLRKGGVFCLQDFFFKEELYGSQEELLEFICGCGIEEVHFSRLGDLVRVPLLLRLRWIRVWSGMIHGKK